MLCQMGTLQINKQIFQIHCRTQTIKNPNWWETDQLVIYTKRSSSWIRDPDSSRVENLNRGPPEFKSSALNHSATPPPLSSNYCKPIRSCIECCTPYPTQSQFLLGIFCHVICIMLKHQLASTAQLQRMTLYKTLMSIGHLQSLKQAKQMPRSCGEKLSRVSVW